MALYASMAMILPPKSSSFMGVFGMRSLKFTPKTAPNRDKARNYLKRFAKTAISITNVKKKTKRVSGKA